MSKASSNFSSEEYRQRFRTKRGGVSASPALRWASCSNFAIATYSLLVDGLIFFDLFDTVLCATLARGHMPQKYILPEVDKWCKAIRHHVVEKDTCH